MKTTYKHLLSAALIAAAALAAPAAFAQKTISDKVSVEDLDIAPGETRLVEVLLDNTCSWTYMWALFDLPEGLRFSPIYAEEVDTDAYTLETVYGPGNQPVQDGKYMTAMATTFANKEYWDAELLRYSEVSGRGSNYPGFIAELADNLLEISLAAGNVALDGKRPVALVKLEATDALDLNSTITINCGFTGSHKDYYTGETFTGELGGTPSVAQVRRVPRNTAVADIAAAPERGDGIYYNLLGQPVTDPAPGIYVRNGKKVLVK